MKAGYFFTHFPYYDNNRKLSYLKSLSFVLIHPDYGPMIFDTGSSHDPDETKDNLKKNFNLSPDDIKWVFNTHIHPDHYGSNFLFKNATIVISKKDYDLAEKIAHTVLNGDIKTFFAEYCPGYRLYYTDEEIEKLKSITKKYWNPKIIGMDLDVKYIEDMPVIPHFIKIIRSFGHTLFHYSFVIKNVHNEIIVSGDSVSNRQVIDSDIENRMNEPHMNLEMFSDSLNEIRKHKGLIIPGHDRPFYYPSKKCIKNSVFDIY